MEKPKDRNKHKPPMKSFEEAMPRCNRYTEGRTVTAAPVLCNMDLETIWRVKAPNLPKYAIAKTPGTKIWVLFKGRRSKAKQLQRCFRKHHMQKKTVKNRITFKSKALAAKSS
jgi:uncharacterized protein (DUF1697 family)